MARQFNGTSQSMESASALTLSPYNKLTIAWWMWWDTFSTNDALAWEYSTNSGANNAFIADINDSGTSVPGFQLHSQTSGTFAGSRIGARPSAAAWHHWAVEFDYTAVGASNAKIAFVYIDGSAQTLTDNVATFTATNQTPGDFVLYLMSRASTSLWAAGRFCELAIWSDNKSSATITDMFNGGSGGNGKSALFYPTNLVYYWKILGTTSPEPENSGGIALTLVGSPTLVTHPGIDYPSTDTLFAQAAL